MNKDLFKKLNLVGIGAAILAFIGVFFPFCGVKMNSTMTSLMSSFGGSSYTSTIQTALASQNKNLVALNVMGILFMLVVIAAGVLYFLGTFMNNKTLDLAALIASGVALLFLIIATAIGNSDLKNFVLYANSDASMEVCKVSFGFGMWFEFIVTIIMVASKWIDELVVKKYLVNGKKNVYGNAPQQGQYMNQQAPQQGQFMNQQAPQQGQFMNQQAPQQGQYMNQQAPQQGQYMNQQAPQQGQNNNMQ